MDEQVLYRDAMKVAEGMAVQLRDTGKVDDEHWLISLGYDLQIHVDYHCFVNTFTPQEVVVDEESWMYDADVECRMSAKRHGVTFFCLKWYTEHEWMQRGTIIPDERLVEVADLAMTAMNLRGDYGIFDITPYRILITTQTFWMLYGDKTGEGTLVIEEPQKEGGMCYVEFPSGEESLMIGSWVSEEDIKDEKR